MKGVLGAALEVQEFLSHAGERFCFIGAIALQRWGEPRLTRDVDVTVLAPYGDERPCADRLLARFRPRISDAREFAVVAVSLVVSLLTLLAMIRIWMGVFWNPAEDLGVERTPSRSGPLGGPPLMVIPTVVLVACSVAIAAAAGPLFSLSERTAADLLDPVSYVNEVLDR